MSSSEERNFNEELAELVHAKELGEWDQDKQDRLEVLLKESSVNREQFLKMTRDSMSLHWLAHERGAEVLEEIQALPEVSKETNITRINHLTHSVKLAWAAALLMACGLVFLLTEKYLSTIEKTDLSIAVLTRSVDAVWSEGHKGYDQNSPLDPSTLKLESGLVQIDFYCGASVVLEGPAEFELIDQEKAFLSYGKLRSYVPEQAHGFTVSMKDADVIDLGTEFALQIDPDGNRQLHVIDGEIELKGHDQSAGSRGELMQGGKAVKLSKAGSGSHEVIPVNEEAFVDFESLYHLSTQKNRDRFQKWNAYSEKISKDPNTLLYFSFENQNSWDRELINHSNRSASNGAIVGCNWSEGRWPGKKALEFKNEADRVRVNVPGDFEQLSYAAWIRLDRLKKSSFTAIFLTDTWSSRDVHWQISDKAQLVMGVKGHNDYKTENDVMAASGDWMFLATIYDLKKQTINHYVNAKLLSKEKLRRDDKVKIGLASVGNWMNSAGEQIGKRNLNGKIDELMVLDRALNHEEIKEMYEIGRPD